jgi:hypothetical protein
MSAMNTPWHTACHAMAHHFTSPARAALAAGGLRQTSRTLSPHTTMSTLILAHVVTGLAGIAAGLTAVAGMLHGKPMPAWNAAFLLTTAASSATGIVFLPTVGVTSAQLVAFFAISFLATAAYARYARRLDGSWNQVYALTAVGALFLTMLITTAQSFLHLPPLKALAPTQHSPVYVAVKLTLLSVFIVVALLAARRTSRS